MQAAYRQYRCMITFSQLMFIGPSLWRSSLSSRYDTRVPLTSTLQSFTEPQNVSRKVKQSKQDICVAPYDKCNVHSYYNNSIHPSSGDSSAHIAPRNWLCNRPCTNCLYYLKRSTFSLEKNWYIYIYKMGQKCEAIMRTSKVFFHLKDSLVNLQ